MLFYVPSICVLHFAIRRDFTNLHTNPHPIIQPAQRQTKGLAWGKRWLCEPVSIFVTPSSGNSYLPHLLMVQALERKEGSGAMPPGSPVCSRVWPGGAETGPSLLQSLQEVNAMGTGWLLGPGEESGPGSPFGAVAGARLSETTTLPHMTSVRRRENPLLPPPST